MLGQDASDDILAAAFPVSLLGSVVTSTELAWVLGCELLCEDWVSPDTKGGVGATDVSIIGGPGPRFDGNACICPGGPEYSNFSTDWICFP